MNINQKEMNIKNLLKGYSLETTPNVYKKYSKFAGLVPLQSSVYITYLPDENSANIVDTAKKLTDEGYDVIPHLPSRRMKDKEDLENYIGKLSEISGCKKMLIIGGEGKQKGKISSSLDVLKTDLLSKYQYKDFVSLI